MTRVARKSVRSAPAARRRRRWLKIAALVAGVPAIVLLAVAGYYYVVIARLIDQRLHGERERVMPRVFARPLELRAGQLLSERQLVDRLNDLEYAERPEAERPGEFALTKTGMTLVPRTGALAGKTVRLLFRRPDAKRAATGPPRGDDRLERIEAPGPLVLSGHTHGGQVRLPFLGAPWCPPGSGRFEAGWYDVRGGRLYVSRGVGTAVVPVRLLCRPEVTIFSLSPAPQSK